MGSTIRPTSGLFLSTNAISRTTISDLPAANSLQIPTPSSQHDTNTFYTTENPSYLEQTILHNHPTILKTRHSRQQRLSQIPVRTYQPYRQDSAQHQTPSRPLPPFPPPPTPSTNLNQTPPPANPSVLDLLLLNTEQTLLTIQNINDLYNTASLIIPPYLAKTLADFQIIEEKSWVTDFPDNVDAACKLRAVKSMLVELGLVVARMSEMAKKDRTQTEVD